MKVEIDGLQVEIDQTKASDWHMFSILRKTDGASSNEQIAIMFEAIEYMTDQTEQSIVEHLGGDTAQAADVLNIANRIIQAATSKN
ncbi:MAG: hypothetical protein IKG22_05545 [Atopobiaceae bacterium]|nr:hypothetical protein [Atopobiaceae bacterium]